MFGLLCGVLLAIGVFAVVGLRDVPATQLVVGALVAAAICAALAIVFAGLKAFRRLSGGGRRLEAEVMERQRAEATLRQNDERFRQLAASTSDVFWMTTPDMLTTHYVSPAYERVWGRSAESLYARPKAWVEAIVPADRERVYATFETLSRDRPEVSVEYRIARPDGTVRWIHDRGFTVRDAAGDVVGHTGVATDVTERKQVETALERQQAELRALFDLLPVMIWFKDTENRIRRVNKAVADAAGLTVEEIEGRPSVEIYPKDAAKYHADDLEVIRSGASKLGIVETVRGPGGESLWVQTDKVPYRDRDGSVIGVVVVAQDITARRRAEESLRLLGSAVEQSNESILITDSVLDLPGPRILFANPAFMRMTGYAPSEVLGKTPRMLQGPHTDRSVLRRLRHDLERGHVFQGESINYRKDGTEYPLEWQVAPIRDEGGTITHFVATQRDITERKRLEAQVMQSQRLETVGKLAGGIAHEFNSILTAIMGQSELMVRDLPAGSALLTSATQIREAAERASVLTRQLLAFGRKQILQPVALDLNTLLTRMEPVLLHLMGPSVDVRVFPAVGLKAVRADVGQIEQVIVNIAMNAADVMPNGGKLTLETANVTLDEDYVRRVPELRAGAYVMLAITDTGPGMREDVRARVFEPFFSTKGIGQGSGLGLSTCYGIIKQSGGQLSVYSEVARGAVFKIYLPQFVDPPEASLGPRDLSDLPRGSETILLVEDDPALREMAATLLRRLGYTVFVAANGVEALSVRNQRDVGHVDLLFTDVVMPHMSGKELATRVRSLSPQTRSLFTSAYTESAIVHQGVLDAGVNLLQKPFTPSMLARRIREMLDGPIA